MATVLDIPELALVEHRQPESETHKVTSVLEYPTRELAVLPELPNPKPNNRRTTAPVAAEFVMGKTERLGTSNENTADKDPSLFPAVNDIRLDCCRSVLLAVAVIIVSETQNVPSTWEGESTARAVE
jgi:hypothetical protein